jgi:hypothetical protein
MNFGLTTIPSFVINKKEFFLLWTKHLFMQLNARVLRE